MQDVEREQEHEAIGDKHRVIGGTVDPAFRNGRAGCTIGDPGDPLCVWSGTADMIEWRVDAFAAIFTDYNAIGRIWAVAPPRRKLSVYIRTAHQGEAHAQVSGTARRSAILRRNPAVSILVDLEFLRGRPTAPIR